MTRNPSAKDAVYVVTGPTSGIGLATAMALSAHGTVLLVGRSRSKLDDVQKRIEQAGGRALTALCDLSDPSSARRAAADIVALDLPIAAVVNNAGVMLSEATRNRLGWDMTFATNHLGPFAFTEALMPSLRSGTTVAFVVSAIEDPERRPAKIMGMRGGRYRSAVASARGEWEPGGCRIPGIDAYATSKQCSLAATLAMARETPRLRFIAIEPGINPTTALGGANAFIRFLFGQVITRLPPFARYRSTPERTAKVIAAAVTGEAIASGVYIDEKGQPMRGSSRAHDPAFQDRVVAETRALLDDVAA